MNRVHRLRLIRNSNGDGQKNKNGCALAVAQFLGVAHKVRYLHSMCDLTRATRKRWKVTSRVSGLKGKSVGASRAKLAAMADAEGFKYFLVRVDNHVILTGRDGKTFVDTSPRERDRRKITHLYGVK